MEGRSFKPISKSHLNFYSSHFVIKLSSVKRLFALLFCLRFFFLSLYIYWFWFFFVSKFPIRGEIVLFTFFCLVFSWNFVSLLFFYLPRCNWFLFFFISRLTINKISNHLVFYVWMSEWVLCLYVRTSIGERMYGCMRSTKI